MNLNVERKNMPNFFNLKSFDRYFLNIENNFEAMSFFNLYATTNYESA